MVSKDISTPVNEHIEGVLNLELSYVEVGIHYTSSAAHFAANSATSPLVVIKPKEKWFMF